MCSRECSLLVQSHLFKGTLSVGTVAFVQGNALSWYSRVCSRECCLLVQSGLFKGMLSVGTVAFVQGNALCWYSRVCSRECSLLVQSRLFKGTCELSDSCLGENDHVVNRSAAIWIYCVHNVLHLPHREGNLYFVLYT